MEFNFASRLDSFEEGIFATLNDKKNELVKAGRKVYNMSVGTPDFKPAQHIMDAVSEAADRERLYIQKSDRQDEAFMRVWTMKEAMIKLTGDGLAAFERTECVPGEVLHMYSRRTVCDEAVVSGALSDIHCRQLVWQGQYVITAVENTNKNQDCIFSKKVYNRL